MSQISPADGIWLIFSITKLYLMIRSENSAVRKVFMTYDVCEKTPLILGTAYLEWIVDQKVSSYRHDLTLFCNVGTCCEYQFRWSKWKSKSQFSPPYINGDKDYKYDEKQNRSGFFLTIRNLREDDLNIEYSYIQYIDENNHQQTTTHNIATEAGNSHPDFRSVVPALELTPFLQNHQIQQEDRSDSLPQFNHPKRSYDLPGFVPGRTYSDRQISPNKKRSKTNVISSSLIKFSSSGDRFFLLLFGRLEYRAP
ncbi:unnamed protein product [Mytilus edulis]|uniref:Uncharacterized protein n=1 Tax=Mytilus edulis TaxID=6550 RepID=A0A8S3V6X2_MYTED|nr:unnamed protein product [Mytilus edulis]